MVSGKEDAREVDAQSLSVLKSRAMDDWYNSEIMKHDVKYNFNSEIYYWILYQLQKDST